MKRSTRRFIFLDYSYLKRVKFRKLEKVCDRLFVFINKEEKNVPVDLVQKMQRFGKHAKWIIADGLHSSQNLDYLISFYLGKLHEKVEEGIEFAILSNEENYDTLIQYINKAGRSCIRVKGANEGHHHEEEEEEEDLDYSMTYATKQQRYTLVDEMRADEELETEVELYTAPKATMVAAPYDELSGEETPVINSSFNDYSILHKEKAHRTSIAIPEDKAVIIETASDTVKRLQLSGNRPALITTLKNYILLHSQDEIVHENINNIISYMEDDKKIFVKDDEVTYFF